MPEPKSPQTQQGLAHFRKVLEAHGLRTNEQRYYAHNLKTDFAIGNNEHQTRIALSDKFLDDLPHNKDSQDALERYVQAVDGRLKCGSPEVFYCLSGLGIQVSIEWPILISAGNGKYTSFILFAVTNQEDGNIALCSIDLGFSPTGTMFDIAMLAVNSARVAVDTGRINFYTPGAHPGSVDNRYQRIERKTQPHERRSQSEIEAFLSGKAYSLGFHIPGNKTEIWAVDPWDGAYLGVTKKELQRAMHVLEARHLLKPGQRPEYFYPTNELIVEKSKQPDDNSVRLVQSKNLTRKNLPSKDDLVKDVSKVLGEYRTSGLILIDLDNFKAVNDTLGHSAGDVCLDGAVAIIAEVIKGRGKVYRWSAHAGDEFAVLLPGFSTLETQATAERIRVDIEQAKLGKDVSVTASIGVCSTDRVDSKSAEQLLDAADKAMYVSKHSGKNKVTAGPIEQKESPDNPIQDSKA
jgi:diguanylate cyclase (GGDEF)-like protein